MKLKLRKSWVALTSLFCMAFAAQAADPGGTLGLVKAVFKNYSDSLNTTGDVESNARGYTLYPDEMYGTTCPEYTTCAWAGYMFMVGGMTYNFKAYYDDYAAVKIAGKWVLKTSKVAENSGSYTPSATDWYKVDFRVANHALEAGGYGKYYGILWKTADDTTWRKVMDDIFLFKTGREDLKYIPSTIYPYDPYDPYGHFLYIFSAEMRPGDKTIMDISYAVLSSSKTNVDVRALAFQDGERSFWKVIRPKTFVADRDGQETAGNIGDGVPANTALNLSWKVPDDWDADLAKVKFEILVSDMAQLPMKTLTIPATEKNPAMTIACNPQSDEDIFNALLWHWADGATNLLNNNGYVDLDYPYPNQEDTTNIRIVDRATIVNRSEALRYLYRKMGWEPLEGGNLMDYVRRMTRKDIWFNSETQTAAIKTATKPDTLYIGEKAYCVIDVSGGPDAESYPVTYLDSEPVNGWGDEYKTTRILLRRCEAGQFDMQKKKEVTFTKPFYMGVFPITQQQYEQVMGLNPTQSGHRGDLCPVEISWNDIRGNSTTYNWPTVKTVDPATFAGRIQARTGLRFDLPTEAQWEYACRAGTSSDYGNGGSDVTDFRLMGYAWPEKPAAVGMCLPNFWGLYDMHGHVGEWCLDYYEENLNSDPAINYAGPESGSPRVIRGASPDSNEASSFFRHGSGTSASFSSNDSTGTVYFGFRLSWAPEE